MKRLLLCAAVLGLLAACQTNGSVHRVYSYDYGFRSGIYDTHYDDDVDVVVVRPDRPRPPPGARPVKPRPLPAHRQPRRLR